MIIIVDENCKDCSQHPDCDGCVRLPQDIMVGENNDRNTYGV